MKRTLWILIGIALVIRTAVRDRGVIIDHLEFGRRLFAGADLYAPFLDPKPLHPVYPPSFGLLTWPFSVLPDTLARAAWGTLQVAALAWIGIILMRWLHRAWPAGIARPGAHALLAVTAVLASRYVLRDTHGGGGNLINLALVLAALEFAERNRQGSAALVLGLSLATKPTAILFLPLLAIRGKWRAALGSLGVAVSLIGLALLVNGHGFEPLLRWWNGTRAYGAMVDLFAEPAAGFPPFSWMNQCLRCAIARYCGAVPVAFAEQVPGFFPGLGWGDATTTWIRHGATALVLIVTFGLAWRDRARPARQLPTVAALFAASLLLSPISWKAHHVALIPALFCLAVAMLADKRRWAWVLAFAYVAACVLGEEIVGKAFKNVQQSLYLVTLGTLSLWLLALSRAFSPSRGIPDDRADAVR